MYCVSICDRQRQEHKSNPVRQQQKHNMVSRCEFMMIVRDTIFADVQGTRKKIDVTPCMSPPLPLFCSPSEIESDFGLWDTIEVDVLAFQQFSQKQM